jgi:hypothetical protein
MNCCCIKLLQYFEILQKNFRQFFYTGHTQKNGAVSIVNSFETAPFFCVCPVYARVKNIVIVLCNN